MTRTAHIAVKGVIAGADDHVPDVEALAAQMPGLAHRDAERLGPRSSARSHSRRYWTARQRAGPVDLAGTPARTTRRSCCNQPRRPGRASASEHPDGLRDDAPDLEATLLGDLDVGKVRVLGFEYDPAVARAVALDGEFAVEQGQHDAPGRRFERAVDDGDVAREQTGADHAVAGEADREGGGRVADQQLVEIERTVEVVVGR